MRKLVSVKNRAWRRGGQNRPFNKRPKPISRNFLITHLDWERVKPRIPSKE